VSTSPHAAKRVSYRHDLVSGGSFSGFVKTSGKALNYLF
jgi:hypothetical protein